MPARNIELAYFEDAGIGGEGQNMRTSMVALGLAAALAALGAPAPAQEGTLRPVLHRRPPLRIEITPSRPAQRQCVDWHVIEHRASGDTVVPR